MKGFYLKAGKNGLDIQVNGGDITFAVGDELLRQTVEAIIGTNKGEWFLNKSEGINFKNILGKKVTPDMIKSELRRALHYVDSSFFITRFETAREGRALKISFTAKNSMGQTIEGASEYA